MASGPRARSIPLLDLHPAPDDFLGEVIEGLQTTPKTLPCKYFYDREGSLLFDQITQLDEYYPTRTEVAILTENMAAIARHIGPRARVVEYGSGNGSKTHLLLDHLDQPTAYVPVEISRRHLLESAQQLQASFPRIEVLPVCADFTQAIKLPQPRGAFERTVVFFPGSTIGNFAKGEAVDLMRRMGAVVGVGGGLLIGVDLQKDRTILERAYNDASDVTARFNLNLLQRINRELGANFDAKGFRHEAIYDDKAGRIEMHLISKTDQTVTIGQSSFEFAKHEVIHTESSHKYTPEGFDELSREAGFEPTVMWTDPNSLFSVRYCQRAR